MAVLTGDMSRLQVTVLSLHGTPDTLTHNHIRSTIYNILMLNELQMILRRTRSSRRPSGGFFRRPLTEKRQSGSMVVGCIGGPCLVCVADPSNLSVGREAASAAQ